MCGSRRARVSPAGQTRRSEARQAADLGVHPEEPTGYHRPDRTGPGTDAAETPHAEINSDRLAARIARMTADLLEVADNGTFTADKAVVRAVALRWIAMSIETAHLGSADKTVACVGEVLAATDRAMAVLVDRYGDQATPVAPLLAGAAVTP